MHTQDSSRDVPESLLKLGDSGAAVRQLRYQLDRIGYRDFDGALSANDDFDDRTRRAVEAFQYDYGLVVDGVVDIKTAAALRHAVHQVRWLAG
jgi:peptidoglycan hydrolase-like protein with peptidoglycan-binding domain